MDILSVTALKVKITLKSQNGALLKGSLKGNRMNIPLLLLNNIYTYQEHMGTQSSSTANTKTTAEKKQQRK